MRDRTTRHLVVPVGKPRLPPDEVLLLFGRPLQFDLCLTVYQRLEVLALLIGYVGGTAHVQDPALLVNRDLNRGKTAA